MTGNYKEKIYHGISLFCIVLCIWLIGQVAADELFGKEKAHHEHRPPMQFHSGEQAERPEQGAGTALDEARIEAELRKYIPEELPLEELEVEIRPGGRLKLEAEVKKQALMDYLTALDMELPGQGTASLLLPDDLRFSAGMTCTLDTESGLVAVTPDEMTLAGKAIGTDALPQTFWDGLGQAVSRLLLAENGAFSTVTFGEGTVYLQ